MAPITVFLILDTVWAANSGSLFQSNSNFRVARFHCFPPQQCHISCCLCVCLPVHLVGFPPASPSLCIPAGRTARATHLTSGQLSKQDAPFTPDPSGENDNWQFTSTSQFVHFRSWPWALLSRWPLTAEDWIHNEWVRVTAVMIKSKLYNYIPK